MSSIKNIIIKNFATQSARQGLTAVQQLILVPLFISFWKVDTYADLIIISTIPTYLLLGNFGLTSYGTNLISIAYNQNRKGEVNFIFKNIFLFTTVLILFFLIILFFLSYLFNFQEALRISS